MINIVNIIIPVYKARDTLPKTLDSLVAQTKTMFLVTLVQDCDGEDYGDIVNEYQRRGLHIVLLHTKINSGPGVARQVGLDANTMCEYVMFVDADDMLLPQAVEFLHREIQRTKGDIVMSSMSAESPYNENYELPAQTTTVQWCGGKIYRTRYLKENNICFHPDLRLNEDAYFNLVAYNGTDKHSKISQYTYLWRYNKNSLTRSDDENGFFVKSWYQYIQSQVYGLCKLAELNRVNPSLFAATLINIYRHHMKAEHLHVNTNIDELNSLYATMGKIQLLKNILSDPEFWKYINTNLKESVIEGNEIYFFKERFIEWINHIWRVV